MCLWLKHHLTLTFSPVSTSISSSNSADVVLNPRAQRHIAVGRIAAAKKGRVHQDCDDWCHRVEREIWFKETHVELDRATWCISEPHASFSHHGASMLCTRICNTRCTR
ncbi:hypothetical protein F5148DRAFT_1191583 [Russula earlei]|uniref:Uncharacterized protein n=1 Tax=Russula earlei TaxID=71964 RepID=A0ACC0UBR6_9AGAM|nr:hypothetical protein F5148DRAFT_1191583 [Russula earlei]